MPIYTYNINTELLNIMSRCNFSVTGYLSFIFSSGYF